MPTLNRLVVTYLVFNWRPDFYPVHDMARPAVFPRSRRANGRKSDCGRPRRRVYQTDGAILRLTASAYGARVYPFMISRPTRTSDVRPYTTAYTDHSGNGVILGTATRTRSPGYCILRRKNLEFDRGLRGESTEASCQVPSRTAVLVNNGTGWFRRAATDRWRLPPSHNATCSPTVLCLRPRIPVLRPRTGRLTTPPRGRARIRPTGQ